MLNLLKNRKIYHFNFLEIIVCFCLSKTVSNRAFLRWKGERPIRNCSRCSNEADENFTLPPKVVLPPPRRFLVVPSANAQWEATRLRFQIWNGQAVKYRPRKNACTCGRHIIRCSVVSAHTCPKFKSWKNTTHVNKVFLVRFLRQSHE